VSLFTGDRAKQRRAGVEIKVREVGELGGSDPLSPPPHPPRKKWLNNSLIERA